MSNTIPDMLRERRAEVVAEAEQIAGRGVAFNRDLTETEQRNFDGLIAEAKKLDERLKEIEAGEQRAHDLENSFEKVTGTRPSLSNRAHDSESVDNLRAMLLEGRSTSVDIAGPARRGYYNPAPRLAPCRPRARRT